MNEDRRIAVTAGGESPMIARFAGPPLRDAGLALPSQYAAAGARSCPDKPALIIDGRVTRYAGLVRQTDSAAAFLARAGLKRGHRIAWFGRNSDLFFPLLFAAMRTGAVVVPINWRNTAVETRYMLEDAGARLVIVDAEFDEVIRETIGAREIAVVHVEGDGESLRAAIGTPTAAPAPDGDPDAICLQLYTSGTTGRPKGVLLSERMIGLNRLSEFQSPDMADWGDDEILLSSMPIFHIAGIGWVLSAMMRGATCVLTADPSPGSILDLCVAHAITRTYMVPTVLRAVLDEVRARGERMQALRGIHYGAAVIDTALLRAAIDEIGCGFLQYYGMTEISGAATILGPAAHDPARPALLRSVGRTMPGVEIEIRDPDLRTCPVGSPGEIWIRCPMLMAGYAGRPRETAEVVVDGWYRSGDGGYFDADGTLFLTDRIKDMIITGGENVYPGRGRGGAPPPSRDCRGSGDRRRRCALGRSGDRRGGMRPRRVARQHRRAGLCPPLARRVQGAQEFDPRRGAAAQRVGQGAARGAAQPVCGRHIEGRQCSLKTSPPPTFAPACRTGLPP